MSSNKKKHTLFKSKINHPNSLENWITLTQGHQIDKKLQLNLSDGFNKKELYELTTIALLYLKK